MRTGYIFCFFFLAIASGKIYAQNQVQDTLVLKSVHIFSTRLDDFGTADKVNTIKTKELQNQNNLSQALSRYSGLNIRSYGISGLSTVSFRGAGSNHSAIFWEGMNLQSPTNGSLDLTQVPLSFIDDVVVQYGAGGSFFGSGAIGGSIQLSGSKPNFEDNPVSLSVRQQFGSFGQRYMGANISTTGLKYQVKMRAFSNTANNDFKFFNRFSNQNERLANAGIDQHGVMIEPSLKLSENSLIKLKYWYQDNEVQIPKTAGQGVDGDDLQKDRFHRAVLSFSKSQPKGRAKFFTGWLKHKLTFNQASPSFSNSWISEYQMDHALKGMLRVQWGLNHTLEQAEVENYGGQDPERNQTALFASVKKLFFNKLETSFSAREVYIDGAFSPFIPSLGLNFQVNSKNAIKAKLARSFRVPTFNDLYWVSGTDNGNPNLKPEKGINMEVGYVFNLDGDRNLNIETTAFSNYIDNWIQWQPNSEGNWSPVNVLEAWLRGVELMGEYKFISSRNLSAGAKLNYTYTNGTQQKVSADGNQSEVGKQLIYTPQHQGSLNTYLKYRNVLLSVNHTFTGKQFTTANNKERWALEKYGLTDISLAYSKTLNKNEFGVSLRINNVFDKVYEIRSSYPMPGRNYNISLNYTLN